MKQGLNSPAWAPETETCLVGLGPLLGLPCTGQAGPGSQSGSGTLVAFLQLWARHDTMLAASNGTLVAGLQKDFSRSIKGELDFWRQTC